MMKIEHAYRATNRNDQFLTAYLKTRKGELGSRKWQANRDNIAKQAQDFTRMMEVHGRTTLHINQIPTPIKKKMLSAVKKGYAQAQNGLWPQVLRFLSIQTGMQNSIPIGYVGKTQFLVWLVDDGGFEEKYDELMAMVTLTGDFSASSLRLPNKNGNTGPYGVPVIPGYQPVECQVRWDDMKKSPNNMANHLMTHFSQVRHLLDRYMVEQAHLRKPLIDLINSDEIIEVPFSTKQ
jgi:hypothetical protein